jgi:DSF synthase
MHMTFISTANNSPAIDKMVSQKLNGNANWERQPLDSGPNQGLESTVYNNLEVELDSRNDTFWCRMKPAERPSYTHDLMKDIGEMQSLIASAFAEISPGAPKPFSWFVMASEVPGIFNLGGDLGHFAQRIREGDLEALRHYGHVAVQAIYRNTIAFGVPVITVALVQGDALGGGFEHALSFDLIVAERSTKLGLPEILFNMFPGMGAYSFLSRRMDRARAEAMILSGRVYTAEELHIMGVVDVLAEDGKGRQAVEDYIAGHNRKFNAHQATYRARRRVNPVTLDELTDVVDLWAEAALNLTVADLKKMDRLCAAQDRRLIAMRLLDPAVMAAE